MCSASIRKSQRKINCYIANLNTLEMDTDNWDRIIVYLCLTKLPKETRREFGKTLNDCAEMTSWTDVNVFLINTFKELTSVKDVPEIYPSTHPKPKFWQDIKNKFDRRVKTFHNMTYVNRNDTRSREKIQIHNKSLHSTQTHPNTYNYPKTQEKLDGSLCKLCKNNHTLRECSSFTSLGVN